MDLKEKLRGRRRRIVTLLAIFFVLGMLMASGLNPLERWLGWSMSSFIWMGTSAILMIGLVWEVLGFFIDRSTGSNTTKPE
jgi:hypothetical protein